MLSSASFKPFCHFLVVVTLCVVGFLVPQNAFAVEKQSGAEDLIRSAMIYNFCKFVQWPDEDQKKIILGILSVPGSQTDFSSINGKLIHQTPIEIRHVATVDEMGQCNIVFIDKNQEAILADAFSVFRNESVLTISEMDDFCTLGGIIQLVHRRGKLRFFINQEAARESQLQLSSQLLKVAKIVEGN